ISGLINIGFCRAACDSGRFLSKRALRSLPAAKRLCDQLVAEQQFGVSHVLYPQQDLAFAVRTRIIAADPSLVSNYTQEQPTEAALACPRDGQFDLDALTGKPREIRAPNQRPIDPGRGYL